MNRLLLRTCVRVGPLGTKKLDVRTALLCGQAVTAAWEIEGDVYISVIPVRFMLAR